MDYIRAFLCDRPHRVKIPSSMLNYAKDSIPKNVLSNEKVVNTGVPHTCSCVLSSNLFFIYTNELKYNALFMKLVKFAHDTALAVQL